MSVDGENPPPRRGPSPLPVHIGLALNEYARVQHRGDIPQQEIDGPSSGKLLGLDEQLVERAGGRHGGIVSPKGPAGSMILFHGCLLHASTSNLSPWNRWAVYLSLCAVSNHIRRFKRPEYIAHRDFTPIRCLPDDCLLKDYDVPLPWKDGTPQEELKAA